MPRPKKKKIQIPEEVMEYFKKTGALGGRTRKANLTSEQRSQIAKKAAAARWKKEQTK